VTLRRRFQLLILGLIILPFIASAVVGWATVALTRENSELDQFLQSRRWIEDTIEQQLMSGTIPASTSSAPARIVVLGSNDVVLFSSVASILAGTRLASPLADIRRAIGNPSKIAVDRVAGPDGREFQVVREMTRPPRRYLDRRTYGFWAPVLVFFLLLVASSAAGSLVMNRFASRVLSLQRATRRIAGGDLETAVLSTGQDELTQLASDLNTMRTALKEQLAGRSRFLMGVSHDLATPLTTIKGYLEALRDGVVRGDAETSPKRSSSRSE